jgi:hypothetical protein
MNIAADDDKVDQPITPWIGPRVILATGEDFPMLRFFLAQVEK